MCGGWEGRRDEDVIQKGKRVDPRRLSSCRFELPHHPFSPPPPSYHPPLSAFHPFKLQNIKSTALSRCAKRRRDTTQSRTAANCTSLQLLKIGLCLFLSSYNRTDQQHERVQEGGGEWGRKGGGEADLPFPANTPHVMTTAGNCGRWAGGARADVVHNMWRYKTGGLL